MEKQIIFLAILTLVFIMPASCSYDVSQTEIERISLPDGFHIDADDETIISVRSQAEFNRFFGTSEISGTKIDFNKHDLIYVQGKSSNGIENINIHWDTNHTPYSLSIAIQNNLTDQFCNWSIAYVMGKSESTPVINSISYDN